MISRLVMLCCTLIPLLCLAVAPQKMEKSGVINLDFVPGQELSNFGQMAVSGHQLSTGMRSPINLEDLVALRENRNRTGGVPAVLFTEPETYSLHTAVKQAPEIRGNAKFAFDRAPGQSVIVVLEVPRNLNGELFVVFKSQTEPLAGPNPVAVPAAAFHPGVSR